jgi:hypothetical protein
MRPIDSDKLNRKIRSRQPWIQNAGCDSTGHGSDCSRGVLSNE